jgi:hypothetical protein
MEISIGTRRDEMTDLVLDLLSELGEYIAHEQSADGFPNSTSLEDGQSVELSASTYANGLMI